MGNLCLPSFIWQQGKTHGQGCHTSKEKAIIFLNFHILKLISKYFHYFLVKEMYYYCGLWLMRGHVAV